tara:strand:+ start:697 stop:846 length:150 start_codon:yes stop_codon:yes gene_type:complete
MNWVINFIWDYFKCKECDEYKKREEELRKLVCDLLKTQNELLNYLNLNK